MLPCPGIARLPSRAAWSPSWPPTSRCWPDRADRRLPRAPVALGRVRRRAGVHPAGDGLRDQRAVADVPAPARRGGWPAAFHDRGPAVRAFVGRWRRGRPHGAGAGALAGPPGARSRRPAGCRLAGAGAGQRRGLVAARLDGAAGGGPVAGARSRGRARGTDRRAAGHGPGAAAIAEARRGVAALGPWPRAGHPDRRRQPGDGAAGGPVHAAAGAAHRPPVHGDGGGGAQGKRLALVGPACSAWSRSCSRCA
jgi:hypothetical protein